MEEGEVGEAGIAVDGRGELWGGGVQASEARITAGGRGGLGKKTEMIFSLEPIVLNTKCYLNLTQQCQEGGKRNCDKG
jgi:hypothetical protein